MKAAKIDKTRGAQAHETQPERVSTQSVQMSRSELELYVRDGRPSGLLLRSIATLKGMKPEAISLATGIPSALVNAIFEEGGVKNIKMGTLKKVATVLGVDLSVMRLASGQVHQLNLANVEASLKSEAGRRTMRAVGLLARSAHVAELKIGTGMRSLRWRKRLHVLQSPSFRAVVIGSRGKGFDVGFVPSAAWVCGSRGNSIVSVENEELAQLLLARDLTEGEFDEMFQGVNALTWESIRIASRANGISKAELMAFVQSRADQLDARDDDEARRAALDGRSFLSLVHSDQRIAVNG